MKQTKFLLGACLALTLAGCSDEVGITTDRLPVSGDEIAFGATAGQFTEPAKRTIYGVPDGENLSNFSRLEIDWVAGKDQVRVFCDQPSEQRWGDYTVVGNETDGYYLQKNDENKPGVRWGDDLTTQHTFYSFYPLTTSNGASISGLQSGTTVRASIPTAQIAGTYHAESDQQTGRTWHIIDPDMSYAMMVGTGKGAPNTDKNVALTYKPIVTVLDVYVTGNTMTDYKVMGVGVRSDNQPIVGTFDYDAAIDQCTYVTPESGSQDDNWAYIETVDDNGSPINIAAGQRMNVKFFLLPQDINSEELEVYVFLNNGQVLRQRLSQEGQGSNLVKGEIVKVLTPQIKPSDVSNWMSAIGNDVLFASQLSLPGTKHSYTYAFYDNNTSWWGDNSEHTNYDYNSGIMQTYQTLDIASQFQAGIRAFNIKVYGNEGCDIYAGNNQHNSNLQLGDFLTTLKQELDATPSEFAIVTIDYVGDERVYNSQEWLDRVCSAIDTWASENPRTDSDNDGTTANNSDGDYFRQVGPNTTVGQMRHGIGVVIMQPDANTNGSGNVNIINNVPTSVQGMNVVDVTMSAGSHGTGTVHMQNLQQLNSPEGATAGGATVGLNLYPYFITEQNVLNRTDMNLVQTKQNLITQLMRASRTNNSGSVSARVNNLYINDLGGFCVVNNDDSKGWADAEWAFQYAPFGVNTWGHEGPLTTLPGFAEMHLTDYRDYADYTFFDDSENPNLGTDIPDRPTADGQTALRITGRGSLERGQGGNNALQAQIMNPYAEGEIRRFVNEGRTPLGIVFMNFAGTETVEFNGITYNVAGVSLPALIVANNFKFALATKAQAQQ